MAKVVYQLSARICIFWQADNRDANKRCANNQIQNKTQQIFKVLKILFNQLKRTKSRDLDNLIAFVSPAR
jgi:hypothetical protein